MTSPLIDGPIRCQRCGEEVAGYEHRVRHVFEGGERLQLGDYAALDCGCEVPDYELEVDYSTEPHRAKLVDTLRKTTVLEFDDSGQHNRVWHADLFGGEESE